MNIWHLIREERISREENAAIVIVATTEAQARLIAADSSDAEGRAAWLERAVVIRLGVADLGVDVGVVCIDCLEA